MIFLSLFGLVAEYVDRKLHARLQNRVGPPWFQPLADFIKLLAKETIIPEQANVTLFKAMPVFAIAAVVTAMFYIPIFFFPGWNIVALQSFTGDAIVVVYLLTIPTLTFFLAGWYSTSLYSTIGAVRSITQLFAYEVPLFMGVLAPCLLANSWSLSEVTAFYQLHPGYAVFNIIGFAVSLVALLGKLEKVPFDIPEAETEIVAGPFTEYSGRYLALFRMAVDIELVVGASLVAAVFLPFGMTEAVPLGLGVVIYVVKVLIVVALISLLRTLFARLRIDQMVDFCWKWMAPAALVQLLINLLVKGCLL
jgi:NADH-quinone oxidoreductase subunit H